ncbi:hypothetical protein BT93_L1359 [Corymbia citriodora subsp. variegata]|uniref:Uncharacterized protein n=1 Tax=Corymbia citriodora subsp. variegata TaxID=360336 RepID=A0A8T0CSD6_CORYI|nr:hypothetical protein BT93_L1359 [Corymbia citriodora subsp. variegata]
MQTPVQPPEVQSPTHSGEQTSARTSSVGDSIADEPEPEPIKNPSATGSGAASALTSATTPTTSTASIPSHGAAETVNLPSAQPSTVPEESEVSDIEMSDLEAIDEILGVVKPRRERPLPSGSDLSTPGAVDSVRAKWEQLYQLTTEGYSQIASNSSVEDRIKNLLDELSFGDDCFTKTPKFQCECKEFATLFADGVEVFRQNCNKIDSSTAAEESFNKLEDRLEAGKKILKERRSSYQAAIDKKGELTEEKERLEALLAEVERQIELNSIHIQHEGRSMKQQLSEVQATTQECHRQRAEVERHLSIRRKCMEDNETLDEHLSTFRSSVKRQLDSARQDSSSKADPQVDLQDCQMSIEEHGQIVPQRTPELFFPEASEPRPRELLIRLAEMSMAVFARCFCC